MRLTITDAFGLGFGHFSHIGSRSIPSRISWNGIVLTVLCVAVILAGWMPLPTNEVPPRALNRSRNILARFAFSMLRIHANLRKMKEQKPN